MLLVLSVGGGKGTLETIRDSLQRSTPVVLARGFGRATDLLDFAIRSTNANYKERAVRDYQWIESKPPIKYENHSFDVLLLPPQYFILF